MAKEGDENGIYKEELEAESRQVAHTDAS
ncbi:uncharacterized protein G2W53_025043 [Senna tora]|uniref:Uncharacterized protein n=1 Tax=Senna tora TaxID=362788 RepID=A0A834WG29_9FABA|nr:uncharacterized protein G2W53_025043 [Senna tora]